MRESRHPYLRVTEPFTVRRALEEEHKLVLLPREAPAAGIGLPHRIKLGLRLGPGAQGSTVCLPVFSSSINLWTLDPRVNPVSVRRGADRQTIGCHGGNSPKVLTRIRTRHVEIEY